MKQGKSMSREELLNSIFGSFEKTIPFFNDKYSGMSLANVPSFSGGLNKVKEFPKALWFFKEQFRHEIALLTLIANTDVGSVLMGFVGLFEKAVEKHSKIFSPSSEDNTHFIIGMRILLDVVSVVVYDYTKIPITEFKNIPKSADLRINAIIDDMLAYKFMKACFYFRVYMSDTAEYKTAVRRVSYLNVDFYKAEVIKNLAAIKVDPKDDLDLTDANIYVKMLPYIDYNFEQMGTILGEINKNLESFKKKGRITMASILYEALWALILNHSEEYGKLFIDSKDMDGNPSHTFKQITKWSKSIGKKKRYVFWPALTALGLVSPYSIFRANDQDMDAFFKKELKNGFDTKSVQSKEAACLCYSNIFVSSTLYPRDYQSIKNKYIPKVFYGVLQKSMLDLSNNPSTSQDNLVPFFVATFRLDLPTFIENFLDGKLTQKMSEGEVYMANILVLKSLLQFAMDEDMPWNLNMFDALKYAAKIRDRFLNQPIRRLAELSLSIEQLSNGSKEMPKKKEKEIRAAYKQNVEYVKLMLDLLFHSKEFALTTRLDQDNKIVSTESDTESLFFNLCNCLKPTFDNTVVERVVRLIKFLFHLDYVQEWDTQSTSLSLTFFKIYYTISSQLSGTLTRSVEKEGNESFTGSVLSLVHHILAQRNAVPLDDAVRKDEKLMKWLVDSDYQMESTLLALLTNKDTQNVQLAGSAMGELAKSVVLMGESVEHQLLKNYEQYSQLPEACILKTGRAAQQKVIRFLLTKIKERTTGNETAWKFVYSLWKRFTIEFTSHNQEASRREPKESGKKKSRGFTDSRSIEMSTHQMLEKTIDTSYWENMMGFLVASSFANEADISAFFSDMLDLVINDNETLAESATGIFLFTAPSSLVLLFTEISKKLAKFVLEDSVVQSKANTRLCEKVIKITLHIVEKSPGFDYMSNIDFESLFTSLVRYFSTVSSEVKIKANLAKLVTKTMKIQKDIVFKNASLFKNYMVSHIIQWLSFFKQQYLESIEYPIKLEMDTMIMDALASLLDGLMLENPVPGDYDLVAERSRIFQEYVHIFSSILEELIQKKKSGGDRLTAKQESKLMHLSVRCLSNMLSSNVNVGLKYILPLGYSDDLDVRKEFVDVFINILKQGTEFKNLEETSKDKYKKMLFSLYAGEFSETLPESPGFDFINAISAVVRSTDLDRMSKCLLNLYMLPGFHTQLIEYFIRLEESSVSLEEKTSLFRKNTISTKMIAYYFRTKGYDYLKAVLTDNILKVIQEIGKKMGDIEVDPHKLGRIIKSEVEEELKKREAEGKKVEENANLASALKGAAVEVSSTVKSVKEEKSESSSSDSESDYSSSSYTESSYSDSEYSSSSYTYSSSSSYSDSEYTSSESESEEDDEEEQNAAEEGKPAAVPQEPKTAAAPKSSVLSEHASNTGNAEYDKLYNEKLEKALLENQERLKKFTRMFLDTILASVEQVPEDIKTVLGILADVLRVRFPDLISVSVAGFFFLRFLVPAVSSPPNDFLPPGTILPMPSRRALILIAKVIQKIANQAAFDTKEKFLIFMNDLLVEYKEPLDKFSEALTNVEAHDEKKETPKVEVTQELIDGDLYEFHKFCYEYRQDLSIYFQKHKMESLAVKFMGLVQEMGLPTAMKQAANANISRSTGKKSGALNIKDGNKHYVKFMKKFTESELEFIGKMYEKVFFYNSRSRLFYFILRNIKSTTDFELLMLHIFNTMRIGTNTFSQPYKVIVDCSGFTLENGAPRTWIRKFKKLSPKNLSDNLQDLIFLSPSSAFLYYVRQNKIKIIKTAKYFSDSNEFFSATKLIRKDFEASAAFQHEKGITSKFEGLKVSSLYFKSPNAVMKVSDKGIFIVATRSDKKTIVDFIHDKEISKVYLDARNKSKVVIEVTSISYSNKYTINSKSANSILSEVETRKRKQLLKSAVKTSGLTLKPSDVPGSLLNIGLLNLGSSFDPLRKSGYNLLTSLANNFGYSIKEVLFEAEKYLVIPQAHYFFVRSLSSEVARTESKITLEFLNQSIRYFDKSGVQGKYLALEYIVPWLENLKDIDSNNPGLTGLIEQLVDLSTTEKQIFPAIQENVWKPLADIESLWGVIIEVLIKKSSPETTDTISQIITTISVRHGREISSLLLSKYTEYMYDHEKMFGSVPGIHYLETISNYILALSFENLINLEENFPLLLHIVMSSLATTSGILRNNMYSVLINITHSLITKRVNAGEYDRDELLSIRDRIDRDDVKTIFGGAPGMPKGEKLPQVPVFSVRKVSILLNSFLVCFKSMEAWKAKLLELLGTSSTNLASPVQPVSLIFLGIIVEDPSYGEELIRWIVDLINKAMGDSGDHKTLLNSCLTCLGDLMRLDIASQGLKSYIGWISLGFLTLGTYRNYKYALETLIGVIDSIPVGVRPRDYFLASRVENKPFNERIIDWEEHLSLNFGVGFEVGLCTLVLSGSSLHRGKSVYILKKLFDLEIKGGGDAAMVFIASLIPLMTEDEILSIVNEHLVGTEFYGSGLPELFFGDNLVYEKNYAYLLVEYLVSILEVLNYEQEKTTVLKILGYAVKNYGIILTKMRERLLGLLNTILSMKGTRSELKEMGMYLYDYLLKSVDSNAEEESPIRIIGFTGISETLSGALSNENAQILGDVKAFIDIIL